MANAPPPILDYASPPPSVEPPGPYTYRRTLLGKIDAAILNRRAAHGILLLLLAAVLLIPAVQFVHRIQQVDTSVYRESGQRQRTALGRWLPTAALLAESEHSKDPYGFGHWFPTPPFVLISLVPLSQMSYAPAGVVWAALKITGFIMVISLLIREIGRGGIGVPVGVLVMTGVFSLRPIVSDLQHGNLNIFMMIWVAAAWLLYLRGRDAWAGVFLALAIVTKITPALLLVYFLYKRAWRVCLGTIVGLALFFVVLPGLYLGFGRNFELLRSWFDMLVAPFALHGYVTREIENQSLYGVLLRLLSNARLLSVEHLPTEQALAAGMEEMIRPLSGLGRLLRPAISLAMVGSLAWLCRARGISRRDPRALLEFGLVLLAMLLMSERTWKHHATTLPLVYLGVWFALTCYPWSDRFRAWFVAGLVAQLLLLLGTSEGLVGDHLGNLLLDGGVFCWGLLLCFIQTAILLSKWPAPLAVDSQAATN